MSNVVEFVPKINKEVVDSKPPMASEVVKMAAAHSAQSHAELNADFTQILTSALAVATKKLAEATAQLNVPAIGAWTANITFLQKTLAKDGANLAKFMGQITPFSE